MSQGKAMIELKSDGKYAGSDFWDATRRSMSTCMRIFALASFITLSCLLGVAAPTLTQAQTVSTAPILDANGWTVFTPSADTNIIYVSDSTGNDSTGVLGDSTHPYKTIAKGISLLRNGYPDWLLLKKGDTWTNQSLANLTKSGRSATEPMLFSSYGTGARPVLKVSAAVNYFGVSSVYATVVDFIAVVDIEFYAYLRDPANGATESSVGTTGVWWNAAPLNWLLIEGCKFSFFVNAVDINPINGLSNLPGNSLQNLYFRRNVVVDQYSNGGNNAGQGVAVSGTVNFVFEQNIIDHNWSATITGAGRNGFRHNFYVGGYTPDGRPPPGGSGVPNGGVLTFAKATGNISTRDPSGSHFRSGGNITNNLFAYSPDAFDIGAPSTATVTVANNVVLSGVDDSANSGYTGAGFGTIVTGAYYPYINTDYYSNGPIFFTNNILAHSANIAANPVGILSTYGSVSGVPTPGTQFLNITATNNIVCGWGANEILDLAGNALGGNNIFTPNFTKSADCNAGGWDGSNQPAGLVDGTRTIETYDSSVLGGPGTFDHFIGLARQQSKSNWNTALMAESLNNYIRAGFGITSSTTPTTPTADTTPPSVPTGLAATAASGTQVNLSWTGSIDNVGVKGYKVFRNGAQVGTTANTSYQDTSTSAGTTYSYTVSAYDAAGNTSAQSSSVSVTTPAPTSVSAPSVAINSPTNGSILNGSATIAVSANSANGIASITITADGKGLATCASVTSCSTTW